MTLDGGGKKYRLPRKKKENHVNLKRQTPRKSFILDFFFQQTISFFGTTHPNPSTFTTNQLLLPVLAALPFQKGFNCSSYIRSLGPHHLHLRHAASAASPRFTITIHETGDNRGSIKEERGNLGREKHNLTLSFFSTSLVVTYLLILHKD